MTLLVLLAVVLLIAINSVCVATEFALVTSRASRLQARAEGGSRGARQA